MQSETVTAAVPTAADTWTDVGTFTVPAGVQRMTKVRLSLAPDWGTTAGSVRCAPIFRIQGSGVLEQNPHEFIGAWCGHSDVTSGGLSNFNLTAEYMVDLPVQTGGTFTVQCLTATEAVTAGTVLANVYYDAGNVVQANSMSQVATATGTTTADAWATLGTVTVPAPGEGNKPTRIKRIGLGVAIDNGTGSVSLRTASRFRLSSSGIGEGGSHEYTGPISTAASIGAVTSVMSHNFGTVWIDVDIPVNAAGSILIEHLYTNETPTASTVGVCLVYE